MSPLTNDSGRSEVELYLKDQAERDLLRFITCGSVDDGKSSLIGRLLYDSKLIFEDQLSALEKDSQKHGTVGEGVDLALLVDGLQAEREQGITIDVAYRFFATDRRRYIVADTPGHEQYTRNMATGASTADLAVILVDARKGILTQTRRHSIIASLMGIRHIILAINKTDLVGYDRAVIEPIEAEYRDFARKLDFATIDVVPLSALKGDNVFHRSEAMPWYGGPSLIELLDAAEITCSGTAMPFRMPVQWVNRPNLDFRGYAGTIAGGTVAPGDTVRSVLSGQETTVKRIVSYGGDLESGTEGQAVTLVLEDEIDVSRGDMLSSSTQPAQLTDQFAAHIIWMADEPLLPERQYRIQIGTQQAVASVTELKYLVNVNSLEHTAGKSVRLNEVAFCNIALDRAVAFDPYRENRAIGSFILIDTYTNATAGAGMVQHGLRRATNLHWQELTLDKQIRATQKHQKPAVLWFTGLSGSGKSTIADLVEKRLYSLGKHSYLLDGDNIRHGLNKDLGFIDADRVENIRRVAEVSRLMADAGLIVLVSFISPFRAERDMARALMPSGEFLEIFVDTPIEVCEARDPKGLYRKARGGLVKNFTGIDSGYDRPEAPELHIQTTQVDAGAAADMVVDMLRRRGLLG
jgi:bifunctional enzyme CysN/CysC